MNVIDIKMDECIIKLKETLPKYLYKRISRYYSIYLNGCISKSECSNLIKGEIFNHCNDEAGFVDYDKYINLVDL